MSEEQVQRGSSGGRRDYDAMDVQLARDVSRLQGRVEGFEAAMARLQDWLQGEVQSVKGNNAASSSAVTTLDTLVRGANGDNGLSARVRALEARVPLDLMLRLVSLEDAELTRKQAEKDARRRWDARTWAVALALFVSLLSLGSRVLFP